MDFIVNPPVNSCPTSSSSNGTTVTSGLTYDGGTLSCLGINYNANLNTVLSAINSAVCSLQSSVSTNITNISTNTTNISNLTTVVNNLNSSDLDISGITWSCISPASSSLNDALSALENKICSLSSSSSSTCPDDGAGSGQVLDYFRPEYAKAFVHEKANKFQLSGFGTGVWTMAEGTTTDPTGCTKVTSAASYDITSGTYTNKEIWVRNSFTDGIKYYVQNTGDPEPADVLDEVKLYKLSTDGAGTVSLATDQREYAPYDETIFRSNTELSSFIGANSITETQLDLSSILSYDSTFTVTNPTDIVHKSYVDTQIASIGSSVWTDLGGASGIYYDASPVGIGTSSPAAGTDLHVFGVLRYTDGNEGLGKWLQSDANGNASWETLDISISVEDEGAPVGTFNTFNFIGAGVNAVDAGGGKMDVTISGTVSTFNDLADVAVASSLTYDTLFYDGANWVNSSTIKNDGTSVAIGNPTSIDATLHLKSASGLALKIETAGGIAAEINSAGVLDYKEQFKYTFTNGGASPLGAGKVLTSDASGNATWETFTSISGTGLAGRIAVWNGTNSQTFGLLRDDGSTVGIGVTPNANIALDVYSSLLIQSIRGVNALSSSSVKKAVEGTALGSNGTNIAGYFNSYNGLNNYSVQLKDGTETIGGGRFLKDVGDGKANWTDITESDIVGFGTYAKVGTYTDGYVPRWNATLNTLQSGSIRDNGLGTIGLDGTVPSSSTVIFATTSKQTGLQINSTSTSSIVRGASFHLSGISTASTTTVNGVSINIGNGSSVANANIGVLSTLTGTLTGVTNKQYGVYSKVNIDSSSDNVGGYFEVSNGGSGNAYSLKLVDGLQAAGKVLTSDANGNASWQTLSVSGISALVDDTTPQLGGTLDANGNIIDMGVNTITDAKVGQWDTAYSWGDHSLAGYALVGSYTAGVIPKWDSTTNTSVNGMIQDDGDKVIIFKNLGVHTTGSKQTFQVSGFVSDNDLSSRLYSPIKSQLSLTAQPTVTGTFSSIHAVTGSFLSTTADSLNGYSLDFSTQYNHSLANGFHIRMLRVSTGDTVSTVSGIRIEPFSIQGTATNVYGIYQVGSELNRFGGNIMSDGQIYSPQYSVGVTTNAATFNCDFGNSMVLDLTAATADITLTFTNMVAGGTYFLKVIQKNANFVNIGTYTVSGGSVKWPSGTAPIITTSPFAFDTIVFYYDGTNLLGNYAQDYQ